MGWRGSMTVPFLSLTSCSKAMPVSLVITWPGQKPNLCTRWAMGWHPTEVMSPSVDSLIKFHLTFGMRQEKQKWNEHSWVSKRCQLEDPRTMPWLLSENPFCQNGWLIKMACTILEQSGASMSGDCWGSWWGCWKEQIPHILGTAALFEHHSILQGWYLHQRIFLSKDNEFHSLKEWSFYYILYFSSDIRYCFYELQSHSLPSSKELLNLRHQLFKVWD